MQHGGQRGTVSVRSHLRGAGSGGGTPFPCRGVSGRSADAEASPAGPGAPAHGGGRARVGLEAKRECRIPSISFFYFLPGVLPVAGVCCGRLRQVVIRCYVMAVWTSAGCSCTHAGFPVTIARRLFARRSELFRAMILMLRLLITRIFTLALCLCWLSSGT